MNLIALDLDGTLEDSRRDMIAAVHRVRASFGLSCRTDEEVAPWINQGMDTLYLKCFDDYLKTGQGSGGIAAVQRAYEGDYMANVARETRLYPGISDVLADIARLGRLVVVTNKPERISRHLLAALKVDQWIAGVVGGDTCGKIKPDPAMLRAAEQLCSFDPTAGLAFMIGDTAGDIRMGRAYGAVTIWCSWGYSGTPGEKPDFIAHAPQHLPALIRSALAGQNFRGAEAAGGGEISRHRYSANQRFER